MRAPQPPELAASIVSSVTRHVRLDLDLAPVRARVRRRLREPSSEDDLKRAERLAVEALDGLPAAELVEGCEGGLAEAHEAALLTAARCREAVDDLRRRGLESWIGGAVRRRLAAEAALDALAGEPEGAGSAAAPAWGCGCGCGCGGPPGERRPG